MDTFSEYFGYFITNCRDNALEELRSNKGYNELKSAQDDLRTELETVISPEAQEMLDKFLETAVAVKAMECNRTLLCGLTTSVEIHKRFDASTDEYKAFAKEYL